MGTLLAVTQLEILAATVWGLKWAQPIAEFVAFVYFFYSYLYCPAFLHLYILCYNCYVRAADIPLLFKIMIQAGDVCSDIYKYRCTST